MLLHIRSLLESLQNITASLVLMGVVYIKEYLSRMKLTAKGKKRKNYEDGFYPIATITRPGLHMLWQAWKNRWVLDALVLFLQGIQLQIPHYHLLLSVRYSDSSPL